MKNNERDLMLEAKEIELGLQKLKAKILEDMNERLKKGEDVTQLREVLQKVDEGINDAINIYHEEEN
ncbi:hypothetical protein [Priestia megaterium]|uniref:hypothetical protein n=1 Tax=Priestia megaterium TaxID=1404 RepID=UPI003CC6B498